MSLENVPTHLSSDSTPEEVRTFMDHYDITPEDMRHMLNNMFGGRFRNQIQLAGLPEVELTPYEQAMEHLERAANPELSEESRWEILRDALRICPDCADVYYFMSKLAATPEEALSFLRQAVSAGERYAGEEAFREDVGQFWSLLETRPYMRARYGLASALWQQGDTDARKEAVSHVQDMLRLNPNDNLGLRHILSAWLIVQGLDEDAGALLEQYPDDFCAAWPYMRALLSFRKEGASRKNRTLLKKARRENPYMLEYLSSPFRIPDALPNSYSPGSEEEAIYCLNNHLAAWEITPGALAWAREMWLEFEMPRNPAGDEGGVRTRELLDMLRSFCRQYLDADYEHLCSKMVLALSRKRTVPYVTGKNGKLESWAAGIVCVVGGMNFLYDKSFEPYIRQDDICKHLGVSLSTVSSKATEIRRMLKLEQVAIFQEEYATKHIKEFNPLRKIRMTEEGLVLLDD